MQKVVFINSKSGTARRGNELEKLLDKLNELPDVKPHLIQKGEDITKLARKLAKEGASVVGVAGGDGTTNAVVNGLAGSDTALAVIPFGTLNHFARDLGITLRPPQAAEKLLADDCPERQIDLGRVNDRYFTNNSSVGLYPRLVKLRERQEGQIGKWRAYARAVGYVLRRPVFTRVRLSVEGKRQPVNVWLVFAANNGMQVALPRPGYRPSLSDGILDLYVLEASHSLALIGIAARLLTGGLKNTKGLNEYQVKEFRINTLRRKSVWVALDGEVVRIAQPLVYRTMPGALKVRVLA